MEAVRMEQIGTISIRDPITGEPAETVPLYGRISDRGKLGGMAFESMAIRMLANKFGEYEKQKRKARSTKKESR